MRANFTFQNAAEIELERGKKTEKFILIITLKAYINGDNFRALSAVKLEKCVARLRVPYDIDSGEFEEFALSVIFIEKYAAV